jgi:adenylate cyclase
VADLRKLAAIVAADVAGYSRLAGADEDRTLARLRALRSDLIDPTVALHNGRVVKRTGDGALFEFRSVVDAVRCAVEVQSAMIERNAGLPPDRHIEFRIGIHLGDVVEESDGDLMGDSVNIAARLEGIAAPGGICLSEDAYRLVRSRLDLAVKDLGVIALKNISTPVRVFSLEVGGPAQPKPRTSAKRTERRKSPALLLGAAAVAALLVMASAGAWYVVGPHLMANSRPAAAHLSIVVLPFTNMSNDAAQDYFADGITENLTTDLSRIRSSFVIARNTAFSFKGKNVNARQISSELGVRYVLEGSVQRDQSRVRVNAQLIDGSTGAHIWAERFEEDIADVFRLQDQVVARLANTLGHELVKAEAQEGLRSKNPDVIDLDMRGMALMTQQITKDGNVAARGWFERALTIDPNDSDGLAGRALTYLVDFAFGWADAGIDYDNRVLGEANRVITLAPDNVLAYDVKSAYLFLTHRANEALGAADAGLAVDRNYAALYGSRSDAESSLGRFEQAKADAEQAMRLSPRDPIIGLWHVSAADAELGLGHFDAAIEQCRTAIDAGFRTYIPYANLAAAYALAGRMDEARSALAEARRLNPSLNVKWMMAHAPAVPRLSDGLRKAGLPEDEAEAERQAAAAITAVVTTGQDRTGDDGGNGNAIVAKPTGRAAKKLSACPGDAESASPTRTCANTRTYGAFRSFGITE